jgi:uncharacterized protein (DUF305 family)
MAPDESPRRSGPRARTVVAAVVAAALLLVAAFAAGNLSAPVASAPSTTSVEAGFARDMQTHHAQAVEMALIVRDATDDVDVRLLAYDIATSQSQQGGQMFAWLKLWDLPQTESEPSMTWMSRPPITGGDAHSGMGMSTAEPDEHVPGGEMPGMATEAELAELRSLSGVEAERLFLTLMIAHHHGGVEMAEAVLERSSEEVVTVLAGAIVTAQAGEITYMESLLAARG